MRSEAVDAWGFSEHHTPLTLRENEPLVVPSQGCQFCHQQQYDDWYASRHRSAWSNDVFQTGYLVEQKDFCVYCHAPLAEPAETLSAPARLRGTSNGNGGVKGLWGGP